MRISHKPAFGSFLLPILLVILGSHPTSGQVSHAGLFDAVWTTVSEQFAGTPQVDWDEVGDLYRRPVSNAATIDEAYLLLQEMVAQLGDGGTFIRTPAEVQEALAQDDPSHIIGVGMLLDITPTDEVFVLDVLSRGPADRAGVLRGERIVAVDGVSTIGKTAAEVASSIRGERGTTVQLTLADPDDGQRMVSITRAPVTFRSETQARTLADGNGYISVSTLGQGAEFDFLSALRRLYVTQGLILDFRRFDGIADAATVLKIAGLFTEEPLGAIVTRQGAFAMEPLRDWGAAGSRSVPAPTALDYYQKPVAIIVDDIAAVNPFSLAFVTGLQESGRAILVGRGTEPGANLGAGQIYFQLPGGGFLSVTSNYLASLKTRTFVTQIEPDVPVPIDRSYLAEWYGGRDADVGAAARALRK